MTILLNTVITTAVTALVTSPEQFRDGNPQSAVIQGAFTYGSGGTTAKAWVQTSMDEGTTWIDVAPLSFTTATLRQIYNVSALTPILTAIPGGDGTITTPAQDGILG